MWVDYRTDAEESQTLINLSLVRFIKQEGQNLTFYFLFGNDSTEVTYSTVDDAIDAYKSYSKWLKNNASKDC